MKYNIFILNLLICFLIFPNFLISQESVYFDPPQKTYRDAMNLFEQANYGASQKLFEQFMTEQPNTANIFYENAKYYSTICAIQLQSKAAPLSVQQFAATFPESVWMPSINFQLGKLFFDDNRYKQVLEAFQKVAPKQLDQAQRAEFYYKKGYSQMKLDQLDGALSSFSQVTKTKSDYSRPAYYYSAHIEYQKGKFDKALIGFKAIENDKKYAKYAQNYIVHIYYEQGKYQQVIDEGTIFLTSADNQNRSEIYRLLANSYFELGNFGQALNYFEQYENTVRHAIEPAEQYRIGYTKFLNQQYKSALGNFQKAIADDQSFAQNAWYYLGFSYLNTDQKKFAQSAFLKAYKLNKDQQLTADALYNYVKVTIELGGDLVNDPVALVRKYIDKNPSNLRINEAYDLLAQLYMTSKKYKEAIQSIEEVNNPTSQLQSTYQLLAYNQGIEFVNNGAYQEAIIYFTKALVYNPDRILQAQTVYWYADALYNLKKYTEAEAKYNQFFSMNAASQTGLYDAALYNYAYAAFNQKAYGRAIDNFKKFLSKNSNNQTMVNDAKLRLADSYFIMKNYDQAQGWYEQVLNTGSSGSDYALYQLAFCNGAKGNFNAKINHLKTLVNNFRNSPLYTDALYEIASSNLIINDQREAIVYFDKLVKEKPQSDLARKSLVKMGFIYYDNNQNDLAIKSMKQVIKNYPASLEAKEALATLQSIYMDMSEMDQYFAYVKTLDFVQISTSEEDSLTFASAENFYSNNDCASAIKSLEEYLKRFPNGGYKLSSYHYLSECYAKQNNYEKAMIYYEKIIVLPDNQYTDIALLKAARISYDNKNFNKSEEYYALLSETAEDQGMILEALDGAMRSAVMNDNLAQAEQFAGEILLIERASEQQKAYAHFIKGKAYLANNSIDNAINEFIQVDKLSQSEIGAEAIFQVAQINFNRNKLDESEELIYQIAEKHPESDYWIAKGFILLADIYLAKNNSFQAEQTLLSVIENYPGDDLKKVAREKLQQIQSVNNSPENNNEKSN